jgi:hypothetical protein
MSEHDEPLFEHLEPPAPPINGHDPEPPPDMADASHRHACVLIPPRRIFQPGEALPSHLTPAEIARACRTRHANIWRACCWYGSLPYSKQGSRLLVLTADAVAFIQQGWQAKRHRRTAAEIAADAVAALGAATAAEPQDPVVVPFRAPPPLPPLPPRLAASNDAVPRLVGRDQLMASLDMAEDEADAFLASGELPVFRLGEQRKVALADLIAWIERCRER